MGGIRILQTPAGEVPFAAQLHAEVNICQWRVVAAAAAAAGDTVSSGKGPALSASGAACLATRGRETLWGGSLKGKAGFEGEGAASLPYLLFTKPSLAYDSLRIRPEGAVCELGVIRSRALHTVGRFGVELERGVASPMVSVSTTSP